MFKAQTKIKTSVVVIILLGVLALDFYAYYVISDRDSKVVQTMSELDQENKKSLNLDKVKKIVKETENNRSKIQNYFIPVGGEVGFIELLESMGKMANVEVRVDSVDLADVKNLEGVTSANAQSSFQLVRVRVGLVGNWSNINRYWELLENLPYRLSFEHINLMISAQASLTDKKMKSLNPGPIWQIGFDLSVLKKK